ncbi:hypothetical protein OROMI_008400 [Orobanche minor]
MFSHTHSYTPQLSSLRSRLRSAMLCKSTSYSFSPITSRIRFDHAVSPSLIATSLSSTIAAVPVSKSVSTRTVDHNMLKTTLNSFSPIASLCAASLSTIMISKLCVAGQSVHSSARAYSNAAISSPNGKIKSPSSTSLISISSSVVDHMLKATQNSFSPIASRCAASLSTLTISKLSVAAQSVHSFARAYSNAAISLLNDRSYLSGKVLKPTSVILEKDYKYEVEQRQVSHASPKDPLIELAFLRAPALDQSLVPRFLMARGGIIFGVIFSKSGEDRIQFMLYEILLKKLRRHRALLSKDGAKGVTALEIFLLGAVAKLGATVVTYSLNVVKSRLQAKQVTDGDKKLQYNGTLDAVMKIIQYEGFSGFYKGMGTKVVQSVLAAAVLFMIKEELVNGARWLLMKNYASSVRSKTS